MPDIIDITRDDIEEARRRIAGDVRRTPLLRIGGSQLGIDCAELWLKLEQLQVGGSFKARGMFNRMRANAIPAAGVVIASGGNAGIAVACAARALGVRCEVFVPEVSSLAKREKLLHLGAEVHVVGASYAEALAASLLHQAGSGALLMHAYDQPEVAAGADTVVLGCTHYHFLAGDIRALYPNTTVVDTSEAVARRAVQVLEERGERAGERHQGGLDIIISGDRGAFEAAMRKIQFETTQVEARR